MDSSFPLFDSLQTDISSLQPDISSFQPDINSFQPDINSLQTDINSLQTDTDINSLQTDTDLQSLTANFITFPARKTSLDLSCYFERLESPGSSATLYAEDEVPMFALCGSVESVLRQKKVECYARECKVRRANRVAILKRKRKSGLISFATRVRYVQRSELAHRRDRCSGRFMKDIEYIDV